MVVSKTKEISTAMVLALGIFMPLGVPAFLDKKRIAKYLNGRPKTKLYI